MPTPQFSNILLIQLGDIGDVVLTTPTIRAARETNPNARVSVLVRKPYGSLLAADPHLYQIVEAEKFRGQLHQVIKLYVLFCWRLWSARYDLVIDLRTGDRGAIYAFLTGARVRIGREGGPKQFWRRLVFTRLLGALKAAPLPAHPGADQSLSVVQEVGIRASDSIPRLHVSPEALRRAREILAGAGIVPDAGIVTINPYSRWRYKEWDDRRWAEVIDQLWAAKKIPVVLIGSPEEAAASEAIVAGRKERAVSVAGKTTLAELAAIVSLSRLHLGVDSAAPHIAAALNVPTVTIHGPTDWRSWRLVDERHRIVSSKMSCLPCNRKGCDDSEVSQCLVQLRSEAVVNAALGILA